MEFYADPQTRATLLTANNKVFLYGGYDDPNNFGDIIQLKGALLQHEDRTPIVVLSYRALKSENYIAELQRWFGVSNFLFISSGVPEQKWTSVSKIKKPGSGGLLHVYGGGYLNSMWGDWKIEQIRSILGLFRPDAYVLSGLQIDEAIVPSLLSLFDDYKPELVGMRDKDSIGYLTASGKELPIHYSFDDVTEVFQRWTSQPIAIKTKAKSALQAKKFALHLNMAEYTGEKSSHYATISESIGKIRSSYATHVPIMLNSFNERRAGFTTDTLGSVVNLQEDFPYHSYSVVNLAQMALDIRTSDDYYPDISNLLYNVEFAVACSYHTALIMSFLKKPVYLIASNDFYRQKRKALGYTDDLGAFLLSPNGFVNDFDKELEARVAWLELFKKHISDL